ncbi:MAG: hypothetical protein FWC70_09360, partial [Defluviitaleaceae bacterium]|nr:hypothetical protein [Defluviitaleaceae bacterium]
MRVFPGRVAVQNFFFAVEIFLLFHKYVQAVRIMPRYIVKQDKNALVSPPTTRTFVANALEKSVQVSSENAQKPAISR